MPPTPDWSWLVPYVPAIAVITVAGIVFAFGLLWIFYQSSPGQTQFVDPDAAWELYKAHHWGGDDWRPGEQDPDEEELRQWDQWKNDLARQEEKRLAEVNEEIARRQALAARQAQEQDSIKRDFPQWLVQLGEAHGLSSYAGLTRLAQWISRILTYCNDNLDGRMPIKVCYQVAQEGAFGQAPNHQCYGRTFFELLSKALARNGLLIEGRGTLARKISPDALGKLQLKS